MRGLATGNSAFSTFVQTLPRLPSVLKRMRPTWHLDRLDQVDAGFLAANGFRGIIWDVDGTLTGDRQDRVRPEAAPAFQALQAMPALKHVVLSNAGEERYAQLGAMFPGLVILRAYGKGDEVLFRRRHGSEDSWSPAELNRQLADGARVIRKPNRVLTDYAVRTLELPREAVLMIGDQYLTDIAGANLGGVRSVKLPTLAPDSFRTSVRFSHVLEKGLYSILYRGA